MVVRHRKFHNFISFHGASYFLFMSIKPLVTEPTYTYTHLPIIPLILLLRPWSHRRLWLFNTCRPYRSSFGLRLCLGLRTRIRKAIPEVLLAFINRHVPLPIRPLDKAIEAFRRAFGTCLGPLCNLCCRDARLGG